MATATMQLSPDLNYSEMVNNHYELGKQGKSETRKQEDYRNPIYAHLQFREGHYDDVLERKTALVTARDDKLKAQRKYKQMDGSFDGYLERVGKNARQKEDPSLAIPTVVQISSMKEIDRIVDELSDTRFDEDEIRWLHSRALIRAIVDFNDNKDHPWHGKMTMDEGYLHANEDGAPHVHARLVLDGEVGRKTAPMPLVNYRRMVADVYSHLPSKDRMKQFRKDVDELSISHLKQSFREAFKEKEYEEYKDILDPYLMLERTGEEAKGKQDAWKAKQDKDAAAKALEEAERIRSEALEQQRLAELRIREAEEKEKENAKEARKLQNKAENVNNSWLEYEKSSELLNREFEYVNNLQRDVVLDIMNEAIVAREQEKEEAFVQRGYIKDVGMTGKQLLDVLKEEQMDEVRSERKSDKGNQGPELPM